MTPVSTSRAVSGSVEENFLRLLDQTCFKHAQKKWVYLRSRFLSAPLAQLALAAMPALPVNNKPSFKAIT